MLEVFGFGTVRISVVTYGFELNGLAFRDGYY